MSQSINTTSEQFDVAAPVTTLPPTGTTPATGPAPSARDVTKDQVASVASDAKEGAAQVVETAKDEARNVADEVRSQTRQMFGQVRGEVTDHAVAQQTRLADTLRSLGRELDGMSRGEQTDQGLAADLAQQASARLDSAATWLGDREPGQVLDEVKRYARRHPGTFLALAGLTGIIAGRLTRSLADDARSDDDTARSATGYSTARYGEPLTANIRTADPTAQDAEYGETRATGLDAQAASPREDLR